MRRRHGGFCVINALALLAMVATALALLDTALAAEAQRSRQGWAEAQLEQLLLAGEKIAGEQLSTGGIAPGRKIELPHDPDQDATELVIGPASVDGDGAQVEIQAASGKYHRGQTVHFRRSAGAWAISGAELSD